MIGKETPMMIKNWTIKEIKVWLSEDRELSEQEWNALKEDPRIGVKKLAKAYERKMKKKKLEQERLQQMWKWEKHCYQQGYRLVAGVDEAGRGPLAGPVVSAAVLLPLDFDVTGMNDSKQLTESQREDLRKRIEQEAIQIGIGIVDAAYIDQHGILQATIQSMHIAVKQLYPMVDYLLIDALTLPQIQLPQKAIVKGDQQSHSIAAASIIAKTTRDAYMLEAANTYPQYHFEHHKGYGTSEHLHQLKKWGPCPIHRRSFAPLREWFPKDH